MNKSHFMRDVYAFATSDEVNSVSLAYDLAKKLSKGQFRKEIDADGNRVRYFEHLRRTAHSLIDRGVTDVDVINAALLHDSIEDNDEVRLVNALIESLFGQRTATLVRYVTKIPKAGYYERLASSIQSTNGCAVIIKMADRLDNLSTLPKDDPEFCRKQKRETLEVLIPNVFIPARQHVLRDKKLCYDSLLDDIVNACR